MLVLLFDSVVHFGDRLFIVFDEFDLLSALSPYTAGGQKKVKIFFFFLRKSCFVIESLHSCQRFVHDCCSKNNVLFQLKEQLSKTI